MCILASAITASAVALTANLYTTNMEERVSLLWTEYTNRIHGVEMAAKIKEASKKKQESNPIFIVNKYLQTKKKSAIGKSSGGIKK